MKKLNCISILGDIKKTMRVMKITAFLILVIGIQLHANTYGQTGNISLDMKSSFRDVLERLEQLSGYHFILEYDQNILEKKVTASYTKQSIDDILKDLLKGTGLTYRIIDRYIAITGKNDYSQEGQSKRKVQGVVTDSSTGEVLPGVSIVIEGTSSGMTTDLNGEYVIEVPSENTTLVFSFIGYEPKKVAVTKESTLNVQLSLDVKRIDEVVVTALGISREKKALGYSVSEIKGEEFTKAREVNVANSLEGRVAGVNVSGMSTGPGGSSRIIIRGNGSLNGDNQPLYVIDGMPIDNTTPGGSAEANGGGLNVDRGDGISGINPDDIENISILKGGTAAALYGSRASNGVVLITTKKGKAQKGITVEYNASYTFDQPLTYQNFQYKYGHGKMGTKPTTQSQAISWGRHSWGALIDGESYISIDGEEHPYSAVHLEDNIKEFYRTGSTGINTVAFSGGDQKSQFRVSFSNTGSKGIFPSTRLNKKIINATFDSHLGSKISLGFMSQFNLEEVHNRTMAGDANGNPNWVAMLANTVDAKQLAPGYLEDGTEFLWNETAYATNPYFVKNRYKTKDTKNRFIGQAHIQYDITKNLFVKGSISRDFYNFKYVGIIPTGTLYTTPSGGGEYHGINSNVSETNMMVTADYSKKFFKNLDFNAMLGVNRRNFENDQTSIDGTEFIIPYFYSYTNVSTLSFTPDDQRSRINSVFGSVDLDYKSLLFLTITGRQDWFSTLNVANNTVFYPSVGGSFLLSQAIRMPQFINFFKIRGSWAQVGGAIPDAYVTKLTYSMIQGGHNGNALQEVSSSTITDSNLKPLTSTTYEFGFDSKFFKNRVGLELTYYNRRTTDDIVQTSIPVTSGYSSVRLNAGELQNKGVELLVTGNPVKSRSFSWDISYNMSYNSSTILSLADGLNTVQMASSVGGWAGIYNDVSRPYGIIKGYKMLKDDRGNTVYDSSTGYEKQSDLVELGKGVAPWAMGVSNTFRYKRLSLDVLIDAKFGNKVFSVMNTYANRFGLLKRTLAGRENGLTLKGVDEEGNDYERTISYTSDAFRLYYDHQKNYSQLFTYDGGFVKLRQIILSYDLPSYLIDAIRVKSASLSFVARNVAILYKRTDGFDPETSITNGNAQGFESFALPRTRNLGVNLKVTF